ncbi:hypothetical protein COU54_03175 [Candidatus Pacearchaeota archaeon CG10_big_fil_rev_8_21_14_0_10_31_24]|nr:MAG: hypothetical protein COU54_03175 [Candidatus Pacearchaeota archaeon CG10_big_fil_rev_8_21_14_0_10_31_24]
MTYSKFKYNYDELAIFSPRDLLRQYPLKENGVPINEDTLPSRYIISYQNSSLHYFKERYFKRRLADYIRKIEGSFKFKIYQMGDIGFTNISGRGAPEAGSYLEELITLGGKEFITIGTAAGMYTKGLFLCNQAIRDDGLSDKYLPPEDFAYPDEDLTKRLSNSMQEKRLRFKTAPTWTTSGFYTEKSTQVKTCVKEGVATIDMEAAGLFAIAQVRNVKIASAFVVSDIIDDDGWTPQFHTDEVRLGIKGLVDASIHCLRMSQNPSGF